MTKFKNEKLAGCLSNTIHNMLKKCLLIIAIHFCLISSLWASEMYIGASSVNITPPLPVALQGQMRLRIATEIQTLVTANIVALENRDGKERETTIFISVDLVQVTEELKLMVRSKVREALPDIDEDKIIINATHTHTGPLTRRELFVLPDGVTSVEQTLELISDQITKGIQEAWNNRSPGSVSWGLGYAKVAVNRRATYYDGSADMYGKTDLPEFRGLEGPEDQAVQTLFFWDEEGQLIATTVNVACPAQEVEGREAINADYWHPVREQLKKRFGSELVVLGWIGAAGDQSPHLMYDSAGEERMRKLRGLDRLEEIARRIVETVENVYEVVKTDRYSEVKLDHEVRELELPKRLVPLKVLNEAKKAIEKIKSNKEKKIQLHRRLKWHQAILDRYEKQTKDPNEMYTTTIHVVRLGDIAICTNQFELFTEFGIRIQARSNALQTFIVQLAGPGTYLPTMEAVKGGGYSAIVQSNEVGPEAGQILVNRTVELINKMWPDGG